MNVRKKLKPKQWAYTPDKQWQPSDVSGPNWISLSEVFKGCETKTAWRRQQNACLLASQPDKRTVLQKPEVETSIPGLLASQPQTTNHISFARGNRQSKESRNWDSGSGEPWAEGSAWRPEGPAGYSPQRSQWVWSQSDVGTGWGVWEAQHQGLLTTDHECKRRRQQIFEKGSNTHTDL